MLIKLMWSHISIIVRFKAVTFYCHLKDQISCLEVAWGVME